MAKVKKMEGGEPDGSPLNHLEETRWLYRLQKERLEIDTKIETRMGKLMPSVSNDVRVAWEMLREIKAIEEEQRETETILPDY